MYITGSTNVVGIGRSLGATVPPVAMCAHCFAVRVSEAGLLCVNCVTLRINEAKMRDEDAERRVFLRWGLAVAAVLTAVIIAGDVWLW